MKPGDRVRKTPAGMALHIFKKSNTGTFIRYTRSKELIIYVDGYAKSTCESGGWNKAFWEKIP